MELTLTYVLSQIVIVISYMFFVRTYYTTSRRKILLYSMLANLFMGASYMLLMAWSGLVMALLAVLRSVIFAKYIDDKISTKKDILILFIFYIMVGILEAITYDGFLSLLPMLAILMYTFAVWQKNSTVYKILGVLVSIVWIIYNIYVNSIFGIILETIMVISAIIGILKDKRNKSKKSVDIT